MRRFSAKISAGFLVKLFTVVVALFLVGCFPNSESHDDREIVSREEFVSFTKGLLTACPLEGCVEKFVWQCHDGDSQWLFYLDVTRQDFVTTTNPVGLLTRGDWLATTENRWILHTPEFGHISATWDPEKASFHFSAEDARCDEPVTETP